MTPGGVFFNPLEGLTVVDKLGITLKGNYLNHVKIHFWGVFLT